MLLGDGLFGWVFAQGVVVPTQGSAHRPLTVGRRVGWDAPPRWTAFFYSLDTFVPILRLYQESNFQPDFRITTVLLGARAGVVVLCWIFVEKVLGWVLTTYS